MEHVKFLELRPYGELSKKLCEATDRVLNSGTYIGGMEVEAFEKEWAEYCDAKYCITTGNGFDALSLSCSYLAENYIPIKPGMIVPWKTCKPSWAAARQTCSPMPMSCTSNLRMAVHIYGQVTLPEVYTKETMVEDCAQAHGASLNGIKAGKYGLMAAWSFYPTKNLGAFGDGGAVTTDDEGVADYIREMRNYGKRDDRGINSRLDPLQAAYLREKLPYLDEWNKRRGENAFEYILRIARGVKVEVPKLALGDVQNYHIFAIETEDRDGLKEYLKDNGVETMVHYPTPPYPTYWSVPEAESWTKRTLSLPVAPHVYPSTCASIARLINQWMGA